MDLSSPLNWNLVFEQNLTPDLRTFTIPTFLSSNIIAVYVLTSGSKPTWFTGGWVNQLVPTALIDNSFSWNIYTQRILLGKNIITFPQSLPVYQLQFTLPSYFLNTFLGVWEYTGTD